MLHTPLSYLIISDNNGLEVYVPRVLFTALSSAELHL